MGTDQQQVLLLGLSVIAGVTIAKFLARVFAPRDPRVHGPAANASQVAAAWRAVESLDLEGKLFNDELAIALAGGKAFSEAMAAAQPYRHKSASRLCSISTVAARTWWIDRAILTALTTPAVPGTRGWLSARLTGSARGPSSPPRQLVLLGAGMDSRAWRLPLPLNGLKVFEVDRQDVLVTKKRALQRAGAEVPGEGGVAQYQLRCESWTAVPSSFFFFQTDDNDDNNDNDKNDDNNMVPTDTSHNEMLLLEALQSNGFDPAAPSVWVLDAVVMFLGDAAVRRLLRTLFEASGPGSTLIGGGVTEEGAGDAQQLVANYENSKSSSTRDRGRNYRCYPLSSIKAWRSTIPLDPGPLLAEGGWVLHETATLPSIGKQICSNMSGSNGNGSSNGNSGSRTSGNGHSHSYGGSFLDGTCDFDDDFLGEVLFIARKPATA